MLLVPLEIKENRYFSKKTGKEVIGKEIKFAELGLNQYAIVTKKYDKVSTFEGTKKTGEAFISHKTTVNYLGQDVGVNISPKGVEPWNNLPLGEVSVSKKENEMTKQDGEKIKFTTYEFKSLAAEKAKENKEESADHEKRLFISRHLKSISKTTDEAKKLLLKLCNQLCIGGVISTQDLHGEMLSEAYTFLKDGGKIKENIDVEKDESDSIPF